MKKPFGFVDITLPQGLRIAQNARQELLHRSQTRHPR